jgi:hypothetical protein
MPLTAISELEEKGYKELAGICRKNKGLWCAEAEEYLLSHSEKL